MTTETIATETEVTVNDLLAGISFESPSLRVARAALEKTQARVLQLQEVVDKEASNEKSTRADAEKMVKNLRRSKLSDEAIMAALNKQFGQKRTVAVGDDRQDHTVSDEDQAAILEFIAGNPGCNKAALRDKFSDVDNQGLNIVVKRAIDDGRVRREGNTRKAVYYMI
jgi:sulfur carrier protein ThiS